MSGRSWIRFSEPFIHPRRKTKTWRVTNRVTGHIVGGVRWESTWRCYVFIPAQTLTPFFDATCLQELAEFCRDRTREQRSTWKRQEQPKGAP